MIKGYIVGDLMDCEEPIIAHGCNALGVMGAGVAYLIQKEYPAAYKAYRDHYEKLGLATGECHTIITRSARTGKRKMIANLITQETCGSDPNEVYVSYQAVRTAFRRLNQHTAYAGSPVAIPKIGAGLANGDWGVVVDIINEEMTDRDVWVYVLNESEIYDG